jgi:transposase
MTMWPRPSHAIPTMTAQVARAAFPNGCLAIRVRDALGELFADVQFAELSATRGRPAVSPARLALVSVLQVAEGLSDRQAADAVRGRIDWKYALGLELADTGFDASVRSEFRARLVAGDQAEHLLHQLLDRLRERGLIAGGGRQRTDATQVLAAVRERNPAGAGDRDAAGRAGGAGRRGADVACRVPAREWSARYGQRARDWRLPKAEATREALAVIVGGDGFAVLFAVLEASYAAEAPSWDRAGCGRSRRYRCFAGCGCSSTTARGRACAGAASASCHPARWRSAAPLTPRPATGSSTGSSAGWAGVATRPTSPRPASPTGPI